MNRNSIIKLYNDRLRKQKKFILEDHGIICPIRAADISVPIGFQTPRALAKDVKQGLEEAVKTITKASEVFDPEEIKCREWTRTKEMTKTVGYFAASCPGYDPNASKEENAKQGILFGFSYCDPRDEFSKDLGILKAMNQTWYLDPDDVCDKEETPFKEMYGTAYFQFHDGILPKWSDKDWEVTTILNELGSPVCINMRVWPMTMTRQFYRFAEKAKAYYKQIQ